VLKLAAHEREAAGDNPAAYQYSSLESVHGPEPPSRDICYMVSSQGVKQTSCARREFFGL
jgi:hypothetical protein